MVNITRKLIAWAGSSYLQQIFERLAYVFLRLMNYGAANHPKDSGEFYLLKLLERYYFSNTPIIIFDVGANIGQFAVGAADIFTKAKIHCFEPSPAALQSLKTRASDRIIVAQAGLGSSKGSFFLYEGHDSSVKASLVQHNELQQGEFVEILTLDDYCMEQGIGIISLLKIDVEGFELEVLKGGSRMIREGRIPFIQFEFGGINHVKQGVSLYNFFEFLPHYTFYRILQRGLVKLKYKPFYEVHLTSNYLAVLDSENQQYLKSNGQ